MKNQIYLLALAVMFSGAVNAEWVMVIDDSKGQFFIEEKAIKRENSVREYWGLQNLRNPKDNIKSAKALHKVDCVSGTTEVIYMSGHSELNSGGNRLMEFIKPSLTFTTKEKPELLPATNFVCAR